MIRIEEFFFQYYRHLYQIFLLQGITSLVKVQFATNYDINKSYLLIVKLHTDHNSEHYDVSDVH